MRHALSVAALGLFVPSALLIGALAVGAVRPQQEQEIQSDLVPGRWKPTAAKQTLELLESPLVLADEGVWRTAPALWIDHADVAWMASLEMTLDGGDALVVRRVDETQFGDAATVARGRLDRPSAATDAAGRTFLVWCALNEDVPSLAFSVGSGDTWSEPRPLETPGHRALRPVVARHGGDVWLAWQAWCDHDDGLPGFDVFAGRLGEEGLTDVKHVRNDAASDWGPALTSSPDGTLWLAWTRFEDDQHDVHAVGWTADANAPRLELCLSDHPADDQHPTLACAPDGSLWCAWDRMDDPRRGRSERREDGQESRGDEASLHVVCVRDGVIHQPHGDLEGGDAGRVGQERLFSWSGGFPRITVDATGCPHLFYRYLDEEGGNSACHSYPVVTQTYDGSTWSPPRLFDHSEGSQEPPAIVRRGEECLVAFHRDDRLLLPRTRLTVEPDEALQNALEERRWFLSGIIGPAALGAAWLPCADASEPPSLTPRTPRAPTQRTGPQAPRRHTLQHDGTEYRVYWGDLHRHSSVSRCLNGIEPAPDDRYVFGRDTLDLDFFALTDHSGHTDPFQWWQLLKSADLYETPDFVTLLGYEWSTARYGHQNVIFRGRDVPLISPRHGLAKTPEKLWELLVPGEAITIPHHPSHGRIATDWSFEDPRFLRLVEVFQAARGSFEFPGCFRQAKTASARGRFIQDALDLGLHFGLVASTDHGNGASYAAVIAPELTRDAIFQALHDRRTYASTARGLFLDVRVDGHLMGSETTVRRKPPTLSIVAEGTADLVDVRVFRNGRSVHAVGKRQLQKGTEEVLELQWWNRFRSSEWRFRLEAEGGTLSLVDEMGSAQLRNAWQQKDERTVTGRQEEDAKTRSPVRELRFEGDPKTPIRVSVQGSTYTASVAELRRRPLRATYRNTKWVLRVRDGREEEYDLTRTLETPRVETTWVDEDCPPEGAYYYVRMVQADGEVAWSSPIMLRPRTRDDSAPRRRRSDEDGP